MPSQAELIRRLELNKEHFSNLDYGENLESKAELNATDVKKISNSYETSIQCISCVKVDVANHRAIHNAIKLADVTVIGHVVRNISAFTTRKAFIYTDSELVVDEVLASSSKGDSLQRSEITITEAGGKIRIGERTIEVGNAKRLRLQKGRSYLLFLKYLPKSQSYETVGLDGYLLGDKNVYSVHPGVEPISDDALLDKAEFLSKIRLAAASAKAVIAK